MASLRAPLRRVSKATMALEDAQHDLHDAILEAREQGASLEEIASVMGRGRETVRRWLAEERLAHPGARISCK